MNCLDALLIYEWAERFIVKKKEEENKEEEEGKKKHRSKYKKRMNTKSAKSPALSLS